MTTQNNDWDSSLEQQFKESTYALICSVCHGGGESEPQITCEKCGGHGLTDWNTELLKKFIQTLLDQTKQDTVKEVIGKIEKLEDDFIVMTSIEISDRGIEGIAKMQFKKQAVNRLLSKLTDQLRSEYGIKDE